MTRPALLTSAVRVPPLCGLCVPRVRFLQGASNPPSMPSACAVFLDFVLHLCHPCAVEVCERHRIAVTREPQCNCASNSACRAGDESNMWHRVQDILGESRRSSERANALVRCSSRAVTAASVSPVSMVSSS